MWKLNLYAVHVNPGSNISSPPMCNNYTVPQTLFQKGGYRAFLWREIQRRTLPSASVTTLWTTGNCKKFDIRNKVTIEWEVSCSGIFTINVWNFFNSWITISFWSKSIYCDVSYSMNTLCTLNTSTNLTASYSLQEIHKHLIHLMLRQNLTCSWVKGSISNTTASFRKTLHLPSQVQAPDRYCYSIILLRMKIFTCNSVNVTMKLEIRLYELRRRRLLHCGCFVTCCFLYRLPSQWMNAPPSQLKMRTRR